MSWQSAGAHIHHLGGALTRLHGTKPIHGIACKIRKRHHFHCVEVMPSATWQLLIADAQGGPVRRRAFSRKKAAERAKRMAGQGLGPFVKDKTARKPESGMGRDRDDFRSAETSVLPPLQVALLETAGKQVTVRVMSACAACGYVEVIVLLIHAWHVTGLAMEGAAAQSTTHTGDFAALHAAGLLASAHCP